MFREGYILVVTANVNESKARGKTQYKQRETSRPSSYQKQRNYQGNYYKDKDEENEIGSKRNVKGKETKKGSQSKEQQPEKLETIKRFEREKKIMQKKNSIEELEKDKRPQLKKRRMEHINWTKSYEDGLYDPEEDYFL